MFGEEIFMKFYALALALAATGIASAQSYNLDFGGTTAPGSGYGAAAGQSGQWQNINSLTANTPVGLTDIGGNATAATLSATTSQFSFSFNNAGTTGDDENLLDDQFDLGGVNTQNSFAVNGLANGVYNVYIYAWASDSDLSRISVDLIGNGAQTSGGTYAGLAAGVTHSVWTNVVVSGGSMNFRTNNLVGFGSLNGMQIQQVPEPATMAVLGLGALAAIRRKRSK